MYALFYRDITEPTIVYDLQNNRVLHGEVRQISVLSSKKCLIDKIPYNLEETSRWRTLRCVPSNPDSTRPRYDVFVAEHATSNIEGVREAPLVDHPSDADLAIRHEIDFFFVMKKSEFVNSFADKRFYSTSSYFDISAYEQRSKFFTDPFGMLVAFGATTFAPNIVQTKTGQFLAEPLSMARWTTMQNGGALFSTALGKAYYSIPGEDDFKRLPGAGLLLAPVNYAHWHTQNLPALFALKQILELGILTEEQVTVVAPAPELANVDILEHCLAVLKMKPKIFDPNKEAVSAFAFDCTLLPSSSSVGEFRWSPYLATALSELREKAEAHNRVLFISREDVDNQRGLVNEREVLHALISAGIPAQRVVANRMSYREQRQLFAQATLVIGTHGGGLTNAIYGGPGCAVLELICDQSDSNRGWYHNLYHLLGHRYAAISFPSIGNEWSSPFRADPDLVLTAVRELL